MAPLRSSTVVRGGIGGPLYDLFMEEGEYQRLVDATESHWWFKATSRLLEQLLSDHLAELGPEATALDAAGGTGATSSWLSRRVTTVLCDIEPVALRAAVDRYPQYLTAMADIKRLPFMDESFDVVMCVTALCHEMNPDPQVIVDEFARVAKPGARIVLLEPHHQWLWRGHDVLTHTGRRFNLPTLRALVRNAGLRVERSTGAQSFLVPAAAVAKLVDRGEPKSDVGRLETGLGGVFPALASAERRLLRHVDLPTGLSAVVVASKPSSSAVGRVADRTRTVR
jgi:ubiquinone/menaquinone biosynthesis C-methylase UbiE